MSQAPQVVDHIELALLGLLEQFKDKPRIEGLLSAMHVESNLLEVALQQILDTTDLDLAEGVHLDAIGRLVGLPRDGKDDPTYRVWIQARKLALQSGGTTAELYAPLKVTDPAALFWIDPEYPAKIRYSFISPPLDDAGAAEHVLLLREAKDAGVGVYFYWWPDVGAATFSFEGDDTSIPWGDMVLGDDPWGGDPGDDNGFSDIAQSVGGRLAGISFF